MSSTSDRTSERTERASAAESRSSLDGHEVVLTGRLASMDREEASQHIERAGGHLALRPTETTQLVVVGAFGWPLARDGQPTRTLLEARELQKRGVPIVIAPEEDFLVALGMDELQQGLHRLYTAEQLARMLSVPVSRIRAWMRQGLLEPARIARRLVWFDFRQVANVRVLFELTERGVGPARIRKSLEELRSALGREQVGYGWLDALEARGPLLFRREDGTLCEPNGQLHLDFRVTEGRRTKSGPVEIAELAKRTNTPEDSADDWFEVGVRAEDEGRLSDAMQAYLNALLAGGPQAETCFNLANVLLALDREGEAMQRYLQAIEIDPDYIEAWNNLGNVFSIQGRLEDAASAFAQALQIEPDYADAHCNLGDTLDRLARHDEAREHWERYLELDPDSTWAVRVRERLDE